MAVPIVLDVNTTAATKVNYKWPGTTAQAEAATVLAKSRLEAALPNGIEVTVPSTAIKAAT